MPGSGHSGAGSTGNRLQRGSLVVAALAVASLLLSACGSAGASKPPAPTKAEIANTCSQIANALSDGPDPGADPVGYALAQVKPLRQIKTTDVGLEKDIAALADGYENVYKTSDKKGTEAAVNTAGKPIDTICPGAF